MRRILAVSGAAIALACALTLSPVAALAAPGNNGDIQVVTTTNSDGSPGCQFAVQLYNFDPLEVTSVLQFSLQAPTEGTIANPIHTDTLTFVGGPGLDTSGTFDLSAYLLSSGATPGSHGYHVKVQTQTPSSNGADTKYKVFWVGPCQILPG